MESYAVIGHPIGHTMSPFIHNRLFALSGKQVNYATFDIDPADLEKSYNATLCRLDGFNVTIPHKQAIIPLLTRLDDSAQKYGAVNCVNGKGEGFNTDAYGFCAALAAKGIAIEGDVLLLGSGGAARTMAFEALSNGCRLTVAARGQRGVLLKNELEQKFNRSVSLLSFDDIKGRYDLVVNATPVGMYPNADCSPLDLTRVEGSKALFDAIYNPRKTVLITQAEGMGMKIAEGMAMLVMQAVRAHEIWYGGKFSQNELDRLIDDANLHMESVFGGKSNE